jgi:hypothetical protein
MLRVESKSLALEEIIGKASLRRKVAGTHFAASRE